MHNFGKKALWTAVALETKKRGGIITLNSTLGKMNREDANWIRLSKVQWRTSVLGVLDQWFSSPVNYSGSND